LQQNYAGKVIVMRAFLAIELPEQIKNGLAGICAGSSCEKGIKWVERDNFHLTLLFLGDIFSDQEQDLVERLALLAKKQPSMTITITDPGAFPDADRPKVIWMAVEAPRELYSLQKEIYRQVKEVGIRVRNNKFSPHITLGRGRAALPPLKTILPSANPLSGEAITVTSFSLIESVLTPRGPIYQVKKRLFFNRAW